MVHIISPIAWSELLGLLEHAAMNRLASLASHYAYKLVRPALFRLPPDGVHRRTIMLGTHIQHSSIAQKLLKYAWAYSDPSLVQQINGIRFANPVGLSAGFDKNIQLAPLMRAVGFGFMEGGTITNQPSSGNPRPWFYRLPHSKSIVVHSGLANEGVAVILQRVQSYPQDTFTGFPLNISVAQTNLPSVETEKKAIRDCVEGLRKVAHTNTAQLMTINISCPNTYNGVSFTEPEALNRLLCGVDRLALRIPLFLKMPVDLPWAEFKQLLDVAAQHRVAGVTIGNLTKIRSLVSSKDILPNTIPGGMSGKPTQQASNELIRHTRRHYKNRFVIIGVGGVFTADDVYTKIRLGADLVALITGMIYQGPQVIGRINRDLAKKIKHDGFKNISEAVGIDA